MKQGLETLKEIKKTEEKQFKLTIMQQVGIVTFLGNVGVTAMVYIWLNEVQPLRSRVIGLIWLGYLFVLIVLKITLNINFKSPLKQVKQLCQSMKKGDLTRPLKIHEMPVELRPIIEEINETLVGLKGVMGKINVEADTLYSVSEVLKENAIENQEIFETIQLATNELSNGAIEQAGNITKTQALMRDYVKRVDMLSLAYAQVKQTMEVGQLKEEGQNILRMMSKIALINEERRASIQEVLLVSEDQQDHSKQMTSLSKNLNDAATSLKKSLTLYLTFSYFGNETRAELTHRVLDTYREKNPNIKFKVDLEILDSKAFYPIIKRQLKYDEAPDLIQLTHPWCAQSDFFVDLAKEDRHLLQGFDKRVLDMCMVNNKLIGLPTGLNAFALHMNHQFCEKYHVPLDIRWNWDNLLEIGGNIHEKNPDAYLLYTTNKLLMVLMRMYIKQKTMKNFIKNDYSFGFNKMHIIEMFDYFMMLFKSGVLFTERLKVKRNGSLTHEEETLLGQEIGMTCRWVSDYEKIRKNLFKGGQVSITMPPIAVNAKISAIPVKPQLILAVNNKSENKNEILKFMHWIYHVPEGIKAWGTNRGPSPTEAGRYIQEQEKLIDGNVSRALQMALYLGGSNENPLSVHEDIVEVMQAISQKVFEGKIDSNEGADQLMERMKIVLNTLRKRNKKHN